MASRFFNPFRLAVGDVSEMNRIVDRITAGFDAVQRALDSNKATKAPTFAVGKGQLVSVTDAPSLVTIWLTSTPTDTLDVGVSISVSTGVPVDVGTGYVVVAPKDGYVVLSLSRVSGSDPTYAHADFTAEIRKVTF